MKKGFLVTGGGRLEVSCCEKGFEYVLLNANDVVMVQGVLEKNNIKFYEAVLEIKDLLKIKDMICFDL